MTTNKNFDPVDRPQHYNEGKIECIDAIESACIGLDGFEGVCTGNAIKYMWRWKKKAKPVLAAAAQISGTTAYQRIIERSDLWTLKSATDAWNPLTSRKL